MPRTNPISCVLRAFAVLVVAAVAVPAVPASAATSAERLVAVVGERTGLPLAKAITGPPERRAVDGWTTFEATFRVRAPGSPYRRWSFALSHEQGFGSFFTAIAERTEETTSSVQTYAWDRKLRRDTVGYSSDLRRFRVSTQKQLRGLGKLRLRLTDTGPLATRTKRCRRTGDELWTSRTRTGRAEGTVRFLPGLTGLPAAVAASDVRVTLTETRHTGEFCRRRGGGCRSPMTLAAFTETPTSIDILAARVDGRIAAGRLEFQRRGSTMWVVDHDAYDWPPPLRIEAGQAFVTAGYPFGRFSGSLTFDAGEETTYRGGGCRWIDTEQAWNTGSMTATLDAGTLTFTGPELEAFTSVAGKAD